MSDKRHLIKLRAKKLGLLIYDARLSSEKTIKECAEIMNTTENQYRSYESGAKQPSLPEIEAFAFHLKIPVEHFWGHKSLSESENGRDKKTTEQLKQIRNRIISTRLKLERTQADVNLDQLSDLTSIKKSMLKKYEEGDEPIPIPELEVITEALSMRIENFFDKHGPIGAWRLRETAFNQFAELPVEVQQYVSKPINRPFIELAMRLSELPVDKLRAIAEHLLEITL